MSFTLSFVIVSSVNELVEADDEQLIVLLPTLMTFEADDELLVVPSSDSNDT